MLPIEETQTLENYAWLIARYRASSGEPLEQRWLLLEAAHVVGQTQFRPHLQVHYLMLTFALQTGALKEMLGQLFRIMLVPLGHLLDRLPLGNSGRSNVSAFESMRPSPEILQIIAKSRNSKN